MVTSLSDCWPEIDAGLVDTIRAIDSPQAVAASSPRRPDPSTGNVTSSIITHTTGVLLSQDSIRILDKLARNSFWGVRNIKSESLIHMTRLGFSELEAAIKELLDAGLVSSKFSRKGPFSLNPSRKEEIEAMLRRFTVTSRST